MKGILYVTVSLICSAFVFFLSYTYIDEVAAASTGYNASARGFCGWEYDFVEHTFTIRDERNNPVIIDSGTEIRPKRLIAEIVLCSILGFGATGMVVFTRSHLMSKNVAEQVAASDR